MVSIIIPTFNEEPNISRLEADLKRLKGSFEVIFSDGFSQDATFSRISFPKIRAARGRGAQMNAAAEYARGDYLWFVHADSRIHEDSIRAIEDSGAPAGCFSLKFDHPGLLMGLIALCSTLRVCLRRIAFGDQGIFIRRDLFYRLGGYRAIPLMEDYQLSMDLKKQGIAICLLPLPIITSRRRFEQRGALAALLDMQLLQHQYRRGESIERIAEAYGALESDKRRQKHE